MVSENNTPLSIYSPESSIDQKKKKKKHRSAIYLQNICRDPCQHLRASKNMKECQR